MLLKGQSFVNITNAYFRRNAASRNGGAVAVLDGSSYAMSKSEVLYNNATWFAGAVYLVGALGEMVDVIFVGNVAGWR